MAPHPKLPEELLSMIISIVGETKDSNEKFTSEQLEALRACALASKRMLSICRVFIFSIIEVGFHGVKEQKLMHLVDIMERNPDLKSRVRFLTLHASGSEMPTSDFERCREILLGFSSLRRLNSRVDIGNPEPDSRIRALQNELLATYISKDTLRSLSLSQHDPLHLLDVFSCPKLQNLDLGGTGLLHLGVSNYMTHNLASFRCSYMPELPLSTLHYFPNLQTLELKGSYRSSPPNDTFTTSPQLPPLDLRFISLQRLSDEFLRSVLDYFLVNARAAHRKPFAALQKIEVSVLSSEETEVIRDLLEHTPSLQNLYFEANSTFSGYDLLSLDDDRFQTTCRSLTSLSLVLDAFKEEDNAYATMFDYIHTFFESISGNNVLESLAISVDVDLDPDYDGDLPLPSSEPWSQLFKILASDVSYPKLTCGNFVLCLHVAGGDLGDGGIEDWMLGWMTSSWNVKAELGLRPNFTFRIYWQ